MTEAPIRAPTMAAGVENSSFLLRNGWWSCEEGPFSRITPSSGEVNPRLKVERRSLAAGRLEQIRVRRSEERRVGKECVRTCSPRWSQCHSKKKIVKSNNNKKKR